MIPLCQHHLSTHISRTESKMLPGLHRSLKEAVGIPRSIHVKAEAGPGSPHQKPSAVQSLLTAVQRKEHHFCLRFGLRQRLFSEGHGPAMVLRTSHVLPISQAQELAFYSQYCENEGWQVKCLCMARQPVGRH